jgi:hypothetical protein
VGGNAIMSDFFGDTEEVKEKQLKRLIKHGSRVFSVKEQAESMVEYAKLLGIQLKISQYSFWNIVEITK